jgi:DNA-binding MarR family transcriptional regulator
MPTALERDQADNVGHLLFTAARLLDERAQARLNAAAGERLARPALMRLLPYLDQTGIRPTELARRVDVSKQAVGQSLAELERRGFVEYVADAADGRARLVRLSKAGVSASRRGLRVLRDLETELAGTVGKRRLRELADTLTLLVTALEALDADV